MEMWRGGRKQGKDETFQAKDNAVSVVARLVVPCEW